MALLDFMGSLIGLPVEVFSSLYRWTFNFDWCYLFQGKGNISTYFLVGKEHFYKELPTLLCAEQDFPFEDY